MKTRVKFQEWPVLGGQEEGLLLGAVSRWGTAISWAPGIGDPVADPRPDMRVVRFFARGDGPWAVYWPSAGEGVNFLRAWHVPLPDGSEAAYDAAMKGDDEAKIVDVEVNGGRGAASNLHFVITNATVVRDVASELDAAMARWHQLLIDDDAAVADALARARDAAEPPLGPETRTVEEGIAPTWLPDVQHLRVLYVRHVTVKSSKVERKTIVVHCPRGAPCVPPHDEDVRTEHHYGVELGLEVEYDANGKVISEIDYAPAPLPR